MNFQVELNIVIEVLIEHRDVKTIRKVDLIETINSFDFHRRLVTRDEQLSNFRVFFRRLLLRLLLERTINILIQKNSFKTQTIFFELNNI